MCSSHQLFLKPSTEKISEWNSCSLLFGHLYVQEYKCKCHANKTLKSDVHSIRWTYDQAPQVGQCDKTFESQDSVFSVGGELNNEV